jgi:hypothetical protein
MTRAAILSTSLLCIGAAMVVLAFTPPGPSPPPDMETTLPSTAPSTSTLPVERPRGTRGLDCCVLDPDMRCGPHAADSIARAEVLEAMRAQRRAADTIPFRLAR